MPKRWNKSHDDALRSLDSVVEEGIDQELVEKVNKIQTPIIVIGAQPKNTWFDPTRPC